ncbi:hypothetical protein DL96DRAFT_1816457 [Flagelloscypha sp. PMI_526]|nr:hypothetical protein DL96DRAFT_1816457 [Flagelloscypha sp. PMI_526]
MTSLAGSAGSTLSSTNPTPKDLDAHQLGVGVFALLILIAVVVASIGAFFWWRKLRTGLNTHTQVDLEASREGKTCVFDEKLSHLPSHWKTTRLDVSHQDIQRCIPVSKPKAKKQRKGRVDHGAMLCTLPASHC